MIRAILKPVGWECELEEASPGPIIVLPLPGFLAFKSEYRDKNNKMEAYNEAGEYLCVEPSRKVQPVEFQWDEE